MKNARPTHARSLLFLASAAVALAGCADSKQDRALRSSPGFKEGYEDGCAAATNQGSDLRDRPVEDKELSDSDPNYRAGWRNGYQTCRPTNVAPGTSPGDNPLSGPAPGLH